MENKRKSNKKHNQNTEEEEWRQRDKFYKWLIATLKLPGFCYEISDIDEVYYTYSQKLLKTTTPTEFIKKINESTLHSMLQDFAEFIGNDNSLSDFKKKEIGNRYRYLEQIIPEKHHQYILKTVMSFDS